MIRSMDKVGGSLVIENEFADLQSLMNVAGLYENEFGDYFTWTNKHNVGIIYSRIDHVLGNIDWLQENIDVSLDILAPSVSDHTLMCLNDHTTPRRNKARFTFNNSVVHEEGYHTTVSNSWNKRLQGRPMTKLWYKLLRL